MNNEVSGEQLFLLYAYPCAEMLEQQDRIKPRHVTWLTENVDNKEDPTHSLLEMCFPMAIQAFGEFAGINPLDYHCWPVETVRRFWREHKGRVPECAVMNGKVETVNEISARVKVGDKVIPVFNRYKLSISPGDTVYVHKNVIVEVETRT